jgi:hypothetical protein
VLQRLERDEYRRKNTPQILQPCRYTRPFSLQISISSHVPDGTFSIYLYTKRPQKDSNACATVSGKFNCPHEYLLYLNYLTSKILHGRRSPRVPPEFRSFHARPLRHPWPTPSGSGMDQASPVHRQPLSLPLCCKNDRNVFNAIQTLFSGFAGAHPLLSIPSKLFSPKQGGRGIPMLPKFFGVSYSRYLQCSQQNTNSLHFFATSTLCFHHFMNSFAQKHPG